MKKNNRFPKTERERRKTREEVQQIKKALIDFAHTKWGKEWVHSLLKIGRPFRMRRGIKYAEDEERINNLTIHKGEIFATVQGTAPMPYRVRINFDLISEEIWSKILDAFTSKLLNLAKLLDGILPEELIWLFEEHDQSLFPDASSGLKAKCSCPDKAIPCKHIAAIILYLGRVIDYNPFILLKLRGKDRDDLIRNFGLEFQQHQSQANSDTPKQKEKTLSPIPEMDIHELISHHSVISTDLDIDFNFRKPKSISSFIQTFGTPQNLEYEKEFKVVINRLYSVIRKSVYKKAILTEKKEKK